MKRICGLFIAVTALLSSCTTIINCGCHEKAMPVDEKKITERCEVSRESPRLQPQVVNRRDSTYLHPAARWMEIMLLHVLQLFMVKDSLRFLKKNLFNNLV